MRERSVARTIHGGGSHRLAGSSRPGPCSARRHARAAPPEDATRHSEFAIARWAAEHLPPGRRALATVSTSGEHCPMCSAAHASVGLGRIVHASSAAQLAQWQAELGAGPPPVRALAIDEVAPGLAVEGPADDLAQEVRRLHGRMRAAG